MQYLHLSTFHCLQCKPRKNFQPKAMLCHLYEQRDIILMKQCNVFISSDTVMRNLTDFPGGQAPLDPPLTHRSHTKANT